MALYKSTSFPFKHAPVSYFRGEEQGCPKLIPYFTTDTTIAAGN